MTKKYTHSIIWGNPYTNPPNNLPRRLLTIQSELHRDDNFNKIINEILEKMYSKGLYGYYQSFDCENDKPQRKWSEEAKIRNRQNRLRKRMQKKYSIPQLLEDAIQEKIKKNPEYYGHFN